MDMTIKIGKKDYSFNSYEIANEFIKIVENSEKYSDAINDIVKSNSYELMSTLADSDNLQKEVFDKLILVQSSGIKKTLIGNKNFSKFADRRSIFFLMCTSSYETLIVLARNLNKLPIDILEFAYEKLIELNIKEINYALAENWDLPPNCLKELAENEDIAIANEARKGLRRIVERI